MRLRWCRCLRLPVLLHANNQFTNIIGVIIYLIYKNNIITCYKCSTSNNKNNIYCTSCGNKINKCCIKCHTIINDKDKYCRSCGEKI